MDLIFCKGLDDPFSILKSHGIERRSKLDKYLDQRTENVVEHEDDGDTSSSSSSSPWKCLPEPGKRLSEQEIIGKTEIIQITALRKPA